MANDTGGCATATCQAKHFSTKDGYKQDDLYYPYHYFWRKTQRTLSRGGTKSIADGCFV